MHKNCVCVCVCVLQCLIQCMVYFKAFSEYFSNEKNILNDWLLLSLDTLPTASMIAPSSFSLASLALSILFPGLPTNAMLYSFN